ncbi:3'(2'),5'-bisphosphate nucleotidase 2 [Wickerhamomyces ciferrii]|uniref:3'(2'),5'-bisphosphate nucleotidase n=1 Tax=Wickerhamomyces ciferrii (strain ATCC 14091 / BCRC 22168 / CBS 111 / JCM 3599 / NBRC 0793 / NRRL Y-1031 F-60-10) TaxID=1206466 RepID=K0KUK8_WICCF|nr:3'(2'),5'-bisphosphate nucleotidase 2 [Wickerhamomyces ciferrii]CCH45647.1 3'(2'),5'-bisphosphate nucleotidase 2 [Wickerhamomyces ciferrii]
MPYEREAYIARLAVQKASLSTRSISNQILANKAQNTITKDDKSPVTIGDFSAQAIIINAIKANFPNDEVVGEEDSNDLKENPELSKAILDNLQKNELEFNEHYKIPENVSLGDSFQAIEQVSQVIDEGNSQGGDKGRFWALDPIDGTKGFLRGDQYAVCLALIEDGIVKVGVIGCPNLPNSFDKSEFQYKGGLFTGILGGGSWYSKLYDSKIIINELGDQIQMKNNLKSTSEIKVCEGVEKSHSSHDEQFKIKDYLGIPIDQTLNLDSQVKYCSLSKGLAELYLRLPISSTYREKIWDHAAGNILITESGGIVTDIKGETLNFGKGRTLQSSGVIAGSKQYHSKVIEAIKSLGL